MPAAPPGDDVSIAATPLPAARTISDRSETVLRRLGLALAVAAVGEALGIVLLGAVGDPRFVLGFDLISFGFIATVVLYPLIGALIIQRRPRTRVAWLMIVLGLMIGFALITYAYGVVGQPPRAAWAFTIPSLVLSQLFFIPAIGTVTTVILLIYPTDHVVSPRWRWLGVVAVVGAIAYDVGTLFHPGPFDSEVLPGVLNPLGADGNLGAAFGTLADAANVVGLGVLILAVLSLVLRYRRADPIVAAQIRWLALAAVLAVSALGVSFLPLDRPLDDLFFGAGLSLLAVMPIAIGIAITRYRLYDIDRLINRALVYGALTAILAGVFTAAVGLAQRLFVAATGQTSDAAIVGTTLVVATLYAPLRKRLEAVVDRRFKFEDRRFGAYRDEVRRALSLLDPVPAAERLIREAVDELDAVGGAILDAAGAVTASAGRWPLADPLRISIPGGSTTIAAIELGPRIGGTPHEQANLEELQRMATLVVHATRLGEPPRPVPAVPAAALPESPESPG
jgi:MFS family permease